MNEARRGEVMGCEVVLSVLQVRSLEGSSRSQAAAASLNHEELRGSENVRKSVINVSSAALHPLFVLIDGRSI